MERINIKKLHLVSRGEDMSIDGYLRIMEDYDGDIIVEVRESSEGNGTRSSVEFCTIISGGGRSENTLKALRELMKAMEKDNQIYSRKSIQGITEYFE